MNFLTDPRAQQAARRATTSMSILDMAAWIGLFASVLFWNNFFWRLIAPADIVEVALSLAISAGYAVVLPMLISLLAPSTPAGMALAETRWKTIGHAIAVAAALYMAAHAFLVLWAWWQSRQTVAQAGQDLFLAVGTVIIFVVVPALSWVQIAPDRWVAEMVQAHKVKQLRLLFQAQIDAMKAQFARNALQIQKGLANLSAAEADELVSSQEAIHRSINRTLGDIVQSLDVITGQSTGVNILPNEEITRLYDDLAASLERAQVRMRQLPPPDTISYVEPAPELAPAADREPVAVTAATASGRYPRAELVVARQDAGTGDRARERATAPADRHGPLRPAGASTAVDEEALRAAVAARSELPGAWSRANLERALSIQKTKANELIRIWKAAGLIYDITNPAHHYAWTSKEV